MLIIEVFADIYINNVKTNYQVSDLGSVYNTKTQKMLKPSPDKDGYLRVSIFTNSKKYTMKVHRLVADAFCINTNPDKYNIVHHKDANVKNNTAENLEWCNTLINNRHTHLCGNYKRLTGELNGASIYTESQIKQVCELLMKEMHPVQISKKLNIPYKMVNSVYKKRVWKYLVMNYDFPKFIFQYTSEESYNILKDIKKEFDNNPLITIKELCKKYNKDYNYIRHKFDIVKNKIS